MSNFWDADPVASPASAPAGAAKDANFWDGDPIAKDSSISANNVARSAATGVPIIGGLLNKAEAVTNAALAPALNPLFDKKDQLAEPSFGERYAHSLRDQEAMDKGFQTAHPIVDTAAKLAGGVAAMAPAMAAAPAAFGLEGPLDVMVARGAASGAGLNAADAAVRGEDPLAAASEGGIIGGAAGPAGKLVGKAVSAIADRLRPPPAVSQNIARVGNTDIPLTESQVTGNPAASAEEQILLRGGRGEPAQAIAQKAQELQEQRINQAKDEVGAGLDPTGQRVAVTPQAAGEHVAGELGTSEEARQAVSDLENGLHVFERKSIGAGLDPTRSRVATTPDQAGEVVANAARQQAADATARAAQEAQAVAQSHQVTRQNLAGAPIADDAHHAAEIVSQEVQAAAQRAADARTAAYDAQAARPGEFNPAMFDHAGNAIRDNLNRGANAVRISDRVTPNTAEGLRVIDEQLGQLRFENQVQRGENVIGPDGRPQARPITPQDVEQVRKQLVILRRQAGSAARMPGGSAEDARGMGRLMDEFDNHVTHGVQAGGFSGDGPAYLAGADRARALHAAYRQTFTSQGGGDKVGRVIEEIIGRHGIEPAPPPRVATAIYGSESKPGGAQAVQVAQRLRNIFGENSPQWGAYKQGLFSHITENAAGRAPEEVADRLHGFLESTHSRALAQVAFSPEERASLAQYADHARTQAPVARAANDKVGRELERIVGSGGQPATPNGVADTLFGKSGLADQEISAKLAQHVRDTYGVNSPQFTAVRQGMWHSITESPGGKLDLNPGKIADRIAEHVNGGGKSTADILFTPAERQQMLDHAAGLRASEPKHGDEIDKVIGRITGRDGGLPASPTEVADFLYGRSGAGDKGISVKLAQRLKGQLSPDGFNAVRQGMWTKLTEPAEGRLDWGPQKIAERLHEFLNGNGGPLSHVLYTSEERALMKKLAGVYKQMIPVKGTTNPSGTAPMLAKIAGGARHALLPLLGFTHGGIPGAGVAYGIDKGLTAIGNAKAARNATKLFYGEQAKRPINPVHARAARLIAQTALTQQNQ